MMEFIQSISAADWGVLAGSAAAAVTAVITAVGNKRGQNISSAQNRALTDMSGVIVDKLVDVGEISKAVQESCVQVVSNVGEALEAFKTGLKENHEQNLAVAAFILECFNQSNLSDEKKSKLQLLFDQMFYTDKTELITKLQDAKVAAEAALSESAEANEALKAEIADLKTQLANATTTTKKSRRI